MNRAARQPPLTPTDVFVTVMQVAAVGLGAQMTVTLDAPVGARVGLGALLIAALLAGRLAAGRDWVRADRTVILTGQAALFALAGHTAGWVTAGVHVAVCALAGAALGVTWTRTRRA